MISIYLHIPFCQSKCSYCSFVSFPILESSGFFESYIISLKKEIRLYAKMINDKEVKTLYFGGGTPNLLGSEGLIQLIEEVESSFDLSNLGELSFEFNPYPEAEIYEMIRKIQACYGKKYPRIRFSFGIQSFDNEVLQLSGRKTLFLGLVDFLRGLQPLKQDNTVFNFDFIAFGKRNRSKKGNRYLWTPAALDFFRDFVDSSFADSFSLYTLELIGNQKWKTYSHDKLISGAYFGTDDEIFEEFSLLKDILLDAGYSRYEISNFALAGKSSIHNRVYWEMGNYIGLGLNSSSFLGWKLLNENICSYLGIQKNSQGVRFKNVSLLNEYCQGYYLDKNEIQIIDEKDYLIESFFLSLRTDRGVKNIKKYESILVDDFEDKLHFFEGKNFLVYDGINLRLSNPGMDVYNSLITEIMKEI